MDRHLLHALRSRLVVDRIAGHVEDTAKCLFADRNGNRSSGCDCLHASYESVGRSHRNTADGLVAEVLCYLNDKVFAVFARDIDRFVYGRKVAFREFDIQYCTDNLSDFTCIWHDNSLSFIFYSIAFAPAMISVSSCVMEPWRARLYCSVSLSIIS